jgi:hypothetical protein
VIGTVFSTGSIAWCGALSHNDYDNNVARITGNCSAASSTRRRSRWERPIGVQSGIAPQRASATAMAMPIRQSVRRVGTTMI